MRLPLRPPRLLFPAACVSVCAAFPRPASAGNFTPDGSLTFDPQAAYANGFEAQVADPDASGPPLDVVEDAASIEGSHLLRVDTSWQPLEIPFRLPSAQAVYRASVWVRGTAIAALGTGYDDDAAGDFVQLFPTGRMTSDDWIELQSAPFSVDGPRGASGVLILMGSFDADAVELVADPSELFMPVRACSGAADPICGPEGQCFAQWCRQASAWVPPAPEGDDPDLGMPRRALLARSLENRLRFFFGPYENRRLDLPAALAQMQSAASGNGRWRFWNGFATAIHRLHDWHSDTSAIASWALDNRRSLNVCFLEGDADLSHAIAAKDPDLPDILVAYTGSGRTWGLSQGDRLVAIDGQHPIAWMRSLIAYDWDYFSPNDHTGWAEFAERMRSSIPRFARAVTVVRCPGGACSAPEEIAVASIPEDDPEDGAKIVRCDNRPTHIVDGVPESHGVGEKVFGGLVKGTQADEKLYGMVWDTLYGSGSSDTAIKAEVAKWAEAKGVLLDHRTGNGGTSAGPEPIIGFVRPPGKVLVDLWRSFSDEEGPKDQAEGIALYEANKAGAWSAGSSSAKTDVPVALLITRCGSASDYFPQAMKGAPRVRIFGPHPTAGAFSSYMSLDYWSGIMHRLSMQDAITPDGAVLVAHGVEPDEIVLPRQSDLILGKDTLAERALAWLRAEVTP